MTPQRYPTLQILRALAAVGIFANHWAEPYFDQLIPQQQLTIDVFFFIEGFFAARLAAGPGWQTGRAIRARFAEIYPIYLVGLMAGAIAVAPLALAGSDGWSIGTFVSAVGRGLLLQPTFSPAVAGSVFPLNPPSWAIVLELWGFTAFWLLRRRLTLPALAISTSLSLTCMLGLALHWYDTNMGWRAAAYWGGVPRMLFGFLGGALLYQITRSFGPLLPRLNPIWVWIAATLILFLRIRLIGLPLLVFAVPLIVWFGAAASQPRWVVALGHQAERLAYGIYLLGFPTMLAIRAAGDRVGIPPTLMGSLVGFVAALSILLMMAWPSIGLLELCRRRAPPDLPANTGPSQKPV